ncbi:MAG: taurine dioxygenase, partial [Rhodospirillaceae bacterium]|nr:taurine dioxygenase [Rhodospirillaceae bacterium]
ITNVDLSRDLDEETFAAIRKALAEHVAVCFPDQPWSPGQMVEFVGRFGPTLVHPYLKSLDGPPAIHQLLKEPEDSLNFGNDWHSDFSNLELPGAFNALYAVEVPEFGGETVICNTAAAYEALSDGMKSLLDGRQAWHGFSSHYVDSYAEIKDQTSDKLIEPEELAVDGDPVRHPVVRSHPENGRKSLYVNPFFTLRLDDMTEAESAPLLGYLYQHCIRPEFCLRIKWRKDMLAIWDNRQSMHYAVNDYHGQRRLMNRVLVMETSRPV